MATTVARLQELLDIKDKELDELREENEQLERQIDSLDSGWSRLTEEKDDGVLPVPRLELVYIQDSEWYRYTVVYRLVMMHLTDKLVMVPLGRTQCSRGTNEPPRADDLPFRDGAHIAHDSAHFGLPAFKIMPGEAPKRIDLSGYPHQIKVGRDHRREG